MQAYRVRWNFLRHRPSSWSHDFVRVFGARNEGAAIEATSADMAVEVVAAEFNLNPSYLEAIEEVAR